MYRGHLKLWRQLEDTSFYQNSHAVHLFIHLIMKANWKDKKIMFNGVEITIKRGSLLFGRKVASLETGIAEGTIYDNLKLLVNSKSINIKTNNKFSVITIVNYNKFNPLKDDTQQQSNSQPTASQQPANTPKELKNERTKELDLNTIVSFWNAFALEHSLSQCSKLTEKRKNRIKAKGQEFIDKFPSVLLNIKDSPFLLGQNDRGWKVSLDFILDRQDAWVKILEGGYSGKVKRSSGNEINKGGDWIGESSVSAKNVI